MRTLFRSLGRCVERGYRESLSGALFEHVTATRGLVLCLYNLTTLYFEAEREDDLRRVGYSKERSVDPQIIVGLLVDRAGFPLQVGCREGNKAETTTIIPVVEAFQAAHGIEDLIIVADAGMLSATNLTALDEARLRFIVGARTTRAPGDLEAHFHWKGDAPTDGQVIDTITPKRGSNTERDKSRKSEPVWDPHTHPGSWRAVWVYSKRRAARDNQTLTAQTNRARAVIAGEKRPKGTRFVTVHQGDQVLDKASITRARSLVGLKGYVTFRPHAPDGRLRGRLLPPRAAARPVSLSGCASTTRTPAPSSTTPVRSPGPPDHGDDLPVRSPLHPGHHRDQHRQDRAQATRPAGRHHQPQRPPPRSRTASDQCRQRHPHRPKTPPPAH